MRQKQKLFVVILVALLGMIDVLFQLKNYISSKNRPLPVPVVINKSTSVLFPQTEFVLPLQVLKAQFMGDEVQVEVLLTGGFFQLQKFFADLAQHGTLFDLQDIKIAVNHGQLTAHINMTLNTRQKTIREKTTFFPDFFGVEISN